MTTSAQNHLQSLPVLGVDLARGQAFLANTKAVEAYRALHGSYALSTVVGQGGQFLVKDCGADSVTLIAYQDFTEKLVSRDVFDKDCIVTFLDEMPLYMHPTPEQLAYFNNEAETYARAASLCVA